MVEAGGVGAGDEYPAGDPLRKCVSRRANGGDVGDGDPDFGQQSSLEPEALSPSENGG
jgi:hypothetical protein